MRGTRSVQIAGGIALVATTLAAAALMQRAREHRYPRPPVSEEALYVTSAPAVRRLSVGYHALAADLYWLRAIQYYGGIKLRLSGAAPAGDEVAPLPEDYDLLYPLLDLTTSLDPDFDIAYRFGAIFLAEPFPGGAGRPDQAIALLEKGLSQRPDKWEYMQDIGFVHYWWRHDYGSAAEWFDQAANVTGAPWWLRSLAATTLAEGGDRESSKLIWESLRQTAEVDWLRRDAERRLLQLRALDDIDALQPIVDRVASQGGTPADWLPFVRAGVLRGIPVDPTGIPYSIDATGRVQLSSTSSLHPLPDEPKRLAPVS